MTQQLESRLDQQVGIMMKRSINVKSATITAVNDLEQILISVQSELILVVGILDIGCNQNQMRMNARLLDLPGTIQTIQETLFVLSASMDARLAPMGPQLHV